jgi:ubiquinone biosynthesis protein COQ9
VMADELWYHAGDQSSDASWYTRRGLLLGVYVSTELCMLSDDSEGFADTWEFLHRRVMDVSQLGERAGTARDVAAAFGSGAASLSSGVLALVEPFVSAQKGDPLGALRSWADLTKPSKERAA